MGFAPACVVQGGGPLLATINVSVGVQFHGTGCSPTPTTISLADFADTPRTHRSLCAMPAVFQIC
jgi:hypothetical protein